MTTDELNYETTNEIPLVNQDSKDFSVIILPNGEHQSIKSVVTLIFQNQLMLIL